MGEYYCTNCGADLDDQPGFDPNKGYWTCTECGKLMYDPNDYHFSSGVVWICDECGACLNTQFGFSDTYSSWTCTECGHTNPINSNEIYESEAAYQEEKARRKSSSYSYDSDDYYDKDDDDDDDDDNDEYSRDVEFNNYNYSYNYSTTPSYHDIGFLDSIEDFFSTVWKWIKRIFYLTITLCVLCMGWMLYYHIKAKEAERIANRVPIGISSVDVIGTDYLNIEKRLEESGFSYIESIEMCDLNYTDINEEGSVVEISIDGMETFDSSSLFNKEDHIVIKYHSLKHENPPMTSEEAKNQNYNDVFNAFKDSGFVNINLVQEKDLILGWITKDGAVESVSIEGDTKYKDTSSVRVDSEITIKYHTFKDK